MAGVTNFMKNKIDFGKKPPNSTDTMIWKFIVVVFLITAISRTLKINILYVIFISGIIWVIYHNHIEKKQLNDKLKSLLSLVKKDEKIFKESNFQEHVNIDIAIGHSRKGEIQESIDIIEKINYETLERGLKIRYDVLYANNLLMLNKSLESALFYIKRATSESDFAYNYLLQAVIELELKKDLESLDSIKKYFENIENRSFFIMDFRTIKSIDKYFENVYANFLLGYYYYKKSDLIKAKEYLSLASKCKYSSYYCKRAYELLNRINLELDKISKKISKD